MDLSRQTGWSFAQSVAYMSHAWGRNEVLTVQEGQKDSAISAESEKQGRFSEKVYYTSVLFSSKFYNSVQVPEIE